MLIAAPRRGRIQRLMYLLLIKFADLVEDIFLETKVAYT